MPVEVAFGRGVSRVEAMLRSPLLVDVLQGGPPCGQTHIRGVPRLRAVWRLRWAGRTLRLPGAGLCVEHEGLVLREAGDAAHELPDVGSVATVVALLPAPPSDERGNCERHTS